MASTAVRVSEHTQKLLRKLAQATGEPLAKVLERAVENYRREQFFAELDAAYATLQADPVLSRSAACPRACCVPWRNACGSCSTSDPSMGHIRVNARTAMRGPRRAG
jgi:hypothetical protein